MEEIYQILINNLKNIRPDQVISIDTEIDNIDKIVKIDIKYKKI